jgi:hypothetical protein
LSKIQLRMAGLVSLLLITAFGCGGSDKVKVYPVSGTVTFDGEPMKGGGSIAFVPTGKDAGKAPGGEIDENGNYVLNTYVEGDGAMAGSFRVVISQVTSEEPESTPDGTPPPKQSAGLAQRYFIPAVYSDFANSPLKATVEESANEINFDLKRIAGDGGKPQQRGA